MALSVHNLSIVEPVYTFVDAETGEPTHIATRLLREAVERYATPVMAEMSAPLIEALKRGELGVEEPHALSLPEVALDTPVLICMWDGLSILADGAHRTWRRWQRGDTDLPAYFVPESVWRNFVIVDIPGSGKFWDHFNRNAKVRS